MADVVAETDRLRLRTWDDEDEFRFYEVMNMPAVMRWLGGLPAPEEWSAGYNRLRTYQQDLGFTFWIVVRKADDAILGFCGLKRANAPGAEAIAGELEIGWGLGGGGGGEGEAKGGGKATPRKRQSPHWIWHSIVSRRRVWSR